MNESALRREANRIETQLQAIRRKLRERLQMEYAQGGLTAPQRLVMSVVVKNEGVSLKDLSRQVSLAHSTVSVIVTRLVDRGLLVRRTSDSDKRQTCIFPAPVVTRFLRKDGPEMTLAPLLHALGKASRQQRQAIAAGLDTLERLLSEP